MLRGEWYDSIVRRGKNGTLLTDECGFDRIKVGPFLSLTRPEDEPFIFPKDAIQVFYVKDRIHVGWELAIEVESRSTLVYYKRTGDVNASEGCGDDDEGEACEDAIPTPPPKSSGRRGALVSVIADDDAGDHVDPSSDEEELESDAEENSDYEFYSEDDEEVVKRRRRAGERFADYHDHELEELESDGEMDLEPVTKKRLQSAAL